MTDSIQNVNQDKAVWPCCKDAVTAPVGGKTSPAKRATLQFAVMLTVGLLFLLWLKKPVTAGIVLGLSGVVLVCGLFIPPAFMAIERFGHNLGKWVATGLTWLLLVPFFYICFVPARIIMAISGKDPLNLKFNSRATTYWIPRKPVTDLRQYEKQH